MNHLENVTTNFNEVAEAIFLNNRQWWYDLNDPTKKLDRNDGELLMLMVSELAEGMEGVRKNLMDDHLPNRKMIEVELADCVIRILDYCGAKGFDIDGAIYEKVAYNTNRADHKREARLSANGKKF